MTNEQKQQLMNMPMGEVVKKYARLFLTNQISREQYEKIIGWKRKNPKSDKKTTGLFL